MTEVVLGYWAIRGLAEPVRLLLEYLEVPYKQNLYGHPQHPEHDWAKDKEQKRQLTAFPNLPYLEDGNKHITESSAIMIYLTNKCNRGDDLLGATSDEKWMNQQILGVQGDLNSILTSQSYNPDYQKIKNDNLQQKVLPKLKELNDHLGRQKTKFMVKNTPSICDFRLYETLKHAGYHYDKLYDQYGNLQQYINNFESIDAIAKYLKSNKFVERPINSPSYAKFY
ncbi:hypothetical protein IMG5_184090 [Ichthyophthirius multifiliis]|uniref:glutathione transferase n=1 Tax=Ichthyophthirius multifiliis TaxID=5932 RepID=G0R3A1_ICHMU|nr:hypothetical protein IMG5_184090 [Ichthyophthirius multifiliis]EGR28044.1 hypothetical protein IMG5_184090 [Ichthyophthirius multifiliis]|eukprot:XP_004027389.1 hypothetical protein IMG5_184090 [Ichthyophthirius multifiliis]